MAKLLQDIKTGADWLVTAFKGDKYELDYSIQSLIEIDKFFNANTKNGAAIKGGRLSNNPGSILFSIGAYVGETFIKNIAGATWQTDDNDPQGEINVAVKLPDGAVVFPVQKVISRFKNGAEDSIYVYGHHITKDIVQEPFDESYWNLSENGGPSKPWWKIW